MDIGRGKETDPRGGGGSGGVVLEMKVGPNSGFLAILESEAGVGFTNPNDGVFVGPSEGCRGGDRTCGDSFDSKEVTVFHADGVSHWGAVSHGVYDDSGVEVSLLDRGQFEIGMGSV